jgi:hypothetical protein
MRVRRRIKVSANKLKAALTNGHKAIDQIDGRSSIARRVRDLVAAYVNDLGGADQLSEGQHTLVRRAAIMTVQLEQMESKFALEGITDAAALDVYQRTTNSLRRLLESLGIHKGRKPRTINEPTDLHEYLRSKRRRPTVLDMEAAE